MLTFLFFSIYSAAAGWPAYECVGASSRVDIELEKASAVVTEGSRALPIPYQYSAEAEDIVHVFESPEEQIYLELHIRFGDYTQAHVFLHSPLGFQQIPCKKIK